MLKTISINISISIYLVRVVIFYISFTSLHLRATNVLIMIYINCRINNINVLITITSMTREPEDHLGTHVADVMGWMVQPCFSGVLCQFSAVVVVVVVVVG